MAQIGCRPRRLPSHVRYGNPGIPGWYLGPLGLALSLRATGFLICPLSRKGTALPGALAASKHHHTPQRTGTLLRGGTSRTFG